MRLRLVREPTEGGATHGTLFVSGQFQCFTLEDPVREVAGQPVKNWKIPGQTAIPAGTYKLGMSVSGRFKRLLPLLEDVPGFTGVRIHAGNTTGDTEGCVLVGNARVGRTLEHSRPALDALMSRLITAFDSDDLVMLEIENAP